MRGSGPVVFAQVTNEVGVDEIAEAMLAGWKATGSAVARE